MRARLVMAIAAAALGFGFSQPAAAGGWYDGGCCDGTAYVHHHGWLIEKAFLELRRATAPCKRASAFIDGFLDTTVDVFELMPIDHGADIGVRLHSVSKFE